MCLGWYSFFALNLKERHGQLGLSMRNNLAAFCVPMIILYMYCRRWNDVFFL